MFSNQFEGNALTLLEQVLARKTSPCNGLGQATHHESEDVRRNVLNISWGLPAKDSDTLANMFNKYSSSQFVVSSGSGSGVFTIVCWHADKLEFYCWRLVLFNTSGCNTKTFARILNGLDWKTYIHNVFAAWLVSTCALLLSHAQVWSKQGDPRRLHYLPTQNKATRESRSIAVLSYFKICITKRRVQLALALGSTELMEYML